MDAIDCRGIGPIARFGGLSGLAALAVGAALVVAGCMGSSPTPRIIYTVLPSSPSPSLIATPSPTATAATATATVSPADSSSVGPSSSATAPALAGTLTVSSATVTSAATEGNWTVSFRTPKITGVADAALAAMTNSITTRVNAYISSFTGGELPAVTGPNGPSTLKGDFSVAYVSPALFSLRFTVETYITGAAHPTTDVGSLNFNIVTGAAIQFSDLFTSPAAALPVLKTQGHAKLAAKLGAQLTWPVSVTIADFGGAWVFTKAGLELNWSQGVMAGMAAGTPSISIPWSALATVIARTGPAAGFLP